jgi:hypothetical protein
MRADTREAVKGVGNPVFCLCNRGCRRRELLAEIHRREQNHVYGLVIDRFPHRSLPGGALGWTEGHLRAAPLTRDAEGSGPV